MLEKLWILESDDQGTWVLLDTTDLWYKTKSLEVMGESEYNKLKNHTIFKSEEKQADIKDKEKCQRNH